MKSLLLYLILSPLFSMAQVRNDFPVDIEIASRFAQYEDVILPKYSNGRFSYINTQTGRHAFKQTFDLAYPFVKSAAVVSVKGKYGIIGRDGKWLKQPVYDVFKLPSYESYIAILHKAGTQAGEEYTYDLYNLKENCGYIYCEKASGSYYYGFKDDKGKWGIKNREGTTTVTPKYDSIGYAYSDKVVVYKGGKIGVVTGKDEVFLPFEYTGVSDRVHYPEHPVTGLFKDGYWYYYDLRQPAASLIVKSRYKCNKMGMALKNTVGIYETGSGYNILFTDGSILPQDYGRIAQNGLAGVRGNSIYILNDDKSAWLYYSDKISENKHITVSKRVKSWGITNADGTILLPYNYESITLYGTIAIIKQGGKFGLFDTASGKAITAVQYESIVFEDEKFTARLGIKQHDFDSGGKDLKTFNE